MIIRIRPMGVNSTSEVSGIEELPGKVNYFIGRDHKKWRTNIPCYSKVKYKNIYPGIDLVFYGRAGQLEYDFLIAPGADPKIIRLAFEGVEKIKRDEKGNLVLKTKTGEIIQRLPLVYQELDGRRQVVSGQYTILGRNEIAFQLASYDRQRALVIDPILVYSTFLGGSDEDRGHDIAVDSSGNVYITGVTGSTDFPLVSSCQDVYGESWDAFVAKLNVSGTALVYYTYLGGSGQDIGRSIAVDASGHAYVTGDASSIDFPLANPLQETFGGSPTDAFVARLNASGSELVYSTYLGGSSNDRGKAISVDSLENAYVTGETLSSDFPILNFYQDQLSGSWDAFVTKISATGTLAYSTFLGGSKTEEGFGIAVDSSGNAYVTGETSSPNFPILNSYQDQLRGSWDAFVTKLNAAGSDLVYSTFLGGGGDDIGTGIAVDSSGNAYVTGFTESSDFPTTSTTSSPYQGTYGGGYHDAFVTKLNAAGSDLIYSTFLGGSNQDQGRGIAVDPSGNAYVSGFTESNNFPTASPYQGISHGYADAFITKLNPSSSDLIYSTFLGGSSYDQGWGIAVDPSGDAYVTGFTDSSDFPTTSPNLGPYNGAYNDAFVTKFIAMTISHSISAEAGADGTISPSGVVIVPDGSDETFHITPNAGYHIEDVQVDGLPVGAESSYTFYNVKEDHTIEASFASDSYTIAASAGPNGSITPSGAVSVSYGTDQAFTITPDTGYNIADVLVDGVSVGPVNAFTFAHVTGNHTINVVFTMKTYTINATTDPCGTVAPLGAISVQEGANQTFSITPDDGSSIKDIIVDGNSVGAVSSYTFYNVKEDHTIEASFASDIYTIAASAGPNGSITPSGAVSVSYGTDQAFTITPDMGYNIADVLVDGVSVGAVNAFTFAHVTGNHTISVVFTMKTYTIIATTDPGGTVAPLGVISVQEGANQTFSITPDDGYSIEDIIVDGNSVGAVSSYTFNNVTQNHAIQAVFTSNGSSDRNMSSGGGCFISVMAGK
ncbi:MAG: SBBP repeat-containing protein [Deltaproteobacteria bacterium]|nr:SBBP repeat-containing protein [Deltaproteobacteria bacterium]